MSMTKPTSEQVTFLASGTGASQRTVLDKLRDVVSVKDFGAVGDGVADDTAAINAALASGAKRVYLPSGTYKVGATLAVPANVSMYGDGPAATIIDGSAATYANLTNGVHISASGGNWTALPALSSNPVAGSSSLVFVSAPSVARGDIVVIYNPSNGSWSNFRTYYRAGEMQRVAGVSGSTVTTQGSLFQGYTGANVNVYVMSNPTTATFSGFALKGLASTANPVFGLQITRGADCCISNIRVTNCSYSGIELVQCYGASVTDCFVQEDAASSFGGDYGLVVSNSTNVSVSGGYYYAARHGITTGGGDSVGAVPNRFVKYANLTATTGSTTTVGALDFHGNCEHCVVDGCTIDGGMVVGGDHISVNGCVIVGRGNGDVLVMGSELRGTTFAFDGNTMQTYYTGASNRGAFFDFGGNTTVLSSNTVVGGIMSFTNNTMDWVVSTPPNSPWLYIYNRGYVGTDISVIIDANSVASTSTTQHCTIRAESTAGAYATVSMQGNVLRNCGGINVRHDAAGATAVRDAIAVGNLIVGATDTSAYGIRFEDIENSSTIIGNTIRGCNNFAIASFGNATTSTATTVIANNTIIDGFLTNTGSSVTNADIMCWYATNAAVTANVLGSADVDRSYGISLDNIGSLLLRDNTAWQAVGTGNYVNAVTAYLPNSIISGSATYDPPNLVDGAGATTTVTVTGAALGDLVECVSFSLDLQGIMVTGYVSAANTVSVRFQNESGAALDLGSGTLRARVRKA